MWAKFLNLPNFFIYDVFKLDILIVFECGKQFFFVEFTVVSGILFGILPWLFLMTVFMPILGKGFFGVKISGYQWLLSLVLHVAYGAVLGFLLSLFINQPF